MSDLKYRPFWDGPIETRIARLEQQLAAAEDRNDPALQLALRVLLQMRAESSTQLAV